MTQNPSIFSEQRFKSFIMLLCLLSFSFFLYSKPVYAASASDEALTVVRENTDIFLGLLTHPDYKDPAKRIALRDQAEQLTLELFDFEEFSMRTLGTRYRSFTVAEQKAFTEAMTQLLIQTYIHNFDNYSGEQVAYLSAREGNNGTRVEVNASVRADGKDIPFSFRMLKKNNNWRVYDVLIENTSLIKNYRSQFSSLLTKAKPEELIAKINEKTEEIRKSN